MKENYESLFKFIGENATNHKTMGEIANIQRQDLKMNFLIHFLTIY